jgi:tetratricopeptide (TPR) repeat protein
MENGKDLNQASQWFDKAIEQNPQAFWVYHQKANCLAKMGKKADAITMANKSMEMAKAANNPDYVALNQKLIASLK